MLIHRRPHFEGDKITTGCHFGCLVDQLSVLDILIGIRIIIFQFEWSRSICRSLPLDTPA